MVGRSLQASQEGIKLAKTALLGVGITQQQLADRLSVTRQPIGKFFTGKSLRGDLFVKICETLKLDWQEIAGIHTTSTPPQGIDALVQSVCESVRSSIQERCGTMRVLDMDQPIGLSAIYTSVNILKKMTRQERPKLSELIERCNDLDFNQFGLADIQQKRVDGLDAVEQHDKLMVLGKPGAGKTTFLKRLALLCINEEFQAKRVPVLITLRAFAETPGQPTLLAYLPQSFERYQNERSGEIADKLQTTLEAGQALILLDGLDEVRDTDNQRVIREIQEFATQFNRNQFVMTCRIAAREYTFERFTEVAVADFDDYQIRDFVTKWFNAKKDSAKSEAFLGKLKNDDRIRELATNPLLLTLLCIVFGESADFPTNRSELYEEGLDVLLKKWDAKRNIERDRVYKKLSLQHKEDLLSHLAYTFFERGEYFFKQRVVVDRIIQFIRNTPNISQDEADLELDGAAVLKSIEAQHGLLIERARNIYSFSHLTFQEYFAARQIKEQRSDALLRDVVSHIAEKRWREVFRLTVEMLPDASQLLQLMKGEIDLILAGDEKLQRLMVWVQQKSESVEASYKLAAIRAFYFALSQNFLLAWDHSSEDVLYYAPSELDTGVHFSLAHALDKTLSNSLERDLDLNFIDDKLGDLSNLLRFENGDCFDYYYEENFQILQSDIKALELEINELLVEFNDSSRDLAPDLHYDLLMLQTLCNNRNSKFPFPVFPDDLFPFSGSTVINRRYPATPRIKGYSNFKEAMTQHLDKVPSNYWNREQDIGTVAWWRCNGESWIDQLRTVTIKHRNIGHDWQFSETQKEKLRQYYDANKLLVDCLNSECYVNPEVRQEIEETLLLPISEIKRRKKS